jgi:hypothetical protein
MKQMKQEKEARRLDFWSAITPIVVVLLTAISTFLITVVFRPQRNDRLESQYRKVLAPLHLLLFFGNDNFTKAINNPEQYKEIERIITDNYYMVPQALQRSWNERRLDEFARGVEVCFNLAAMKLGYYQNDYWIKKHYKKIQRLKDVEAYLRKKATNDRRVPCAVIISMIIMSAFLLARISLDSSNGISIFYIALLFALWIIVAISAIRKS